MINIWRKILKTGTVTKEYHALLPSQNFRGKLSVTIDQCNECETCVEACPVGAISLKMTKKDRTLTIDYTKCFYCGVCVDACPTGAIKQTNAQKNSSKKRKDLIESFKTTRTKEED